MKTHLHKTNIFFKFINCLKNIKFSLTYHRAVTPEPVWGRRYLSNQQDCHTPFYIPLDRRKPPRLQNGVKNSIVRIYSETVGYYIHLPTDPAYLGIEPC